MVLRQALVPSQDDDAVLLRLLHGLGVPPSAMTELFEQLSRAAYIASAGAGPHLTALVADLLRGTWFRLDGASALVLTQRGSRPGDPLADLLFAFTFSAYVRSAEQALQSADLQTYCPATAAPAPWCDWEPVSQVGIASWADDYVMLQVSRDVGGLLARTRAATEVLVSQATAAGMEVSFARDKTAVLLSSDCSLADRGEVLQDPELGACLALHNPVLGSTHLLPIVDSYRHLGGILTANGVPAAEVSFRSSQALGMLRPLHRRLFSALAIPLTLRRTLLRSLVVSRFVFAGAVIPLHTALHRRSWDRAYLRLWRGLCKWSRPDQQPHSFLVLRMAQAPSPPPAVALMRGVLLQRLLVHGPSTLLHLLHVHWRADPHHSWLGMFARDVQAVAMYCPAAQVVLDSACSVTALVEAVQADAAWWLRQVKCAIRQYGSDLEKWANQVRPIGAEGHPTDVAEMPSPPVQARPFQCRLCDATCASQTSGIARGP